MVNEKEECRKAALAIEARIDLHVEILSTPLPERAWHVNLDWGFADGVEITYECADGTDLSATFGPEELKVFRSHPKQETLEKILELAINISRAHSRSNNKPERRPTAAM